MSYLIACDEYADADAGRPGQGLRRSRRSARPASRPPPTPPAPRRSRPSLRRAGRRLRSTRSSSPGRLGPGQRRNRPDRGRARHTHHHPKQDTARAMTAAPGRDDRSAEGEAAARRPRLLRPAVVAGSMILVTLAAVAIFLIVQSIPALGATPTRRPLLTHQLLGLRRPARSSARSGPRSSRCSWRCRSSIGIALFISHYAPRRLAPGLGYVVDLLAAVPSVVFGLWGIGVLAPGRAARLRLARRATSAGSRSSPAPSRPPAARSSPSAIVLAVMILPIITAICREIFLQTPGPARGGRARPRRDPLGDDPDGGAARSAARASSRPRCSASAAPSARRWPSPWCSRPPATVTFQLLTSQNPSTIAANIALNFPEAYGIERQRPDRDRPHPVRRHPRGQHVARWIVNRRKEFSGAN